MAVHHSNATMESGFSSKRPRNLPNRLPVPQPEHRHTFRSTLRSSLLPLQTACSATPSSTPGLPVIESFATVGPGEEFPPEKPSCGCHFPKYCALPSAVAYFQVTHHRPWRQLRISGSWPEKHQFSVNENGESEKHAPHPMNRGGDHLGIRGGKRPASVARSSRR